MSRPSLYTEPLALEICQRLSAGESLRSICRDDHMPDRATVAEWVYTDRSGFAARYNKARDVGLDVMADDCIEIADDGRNDTYTDDEGRPRTDHDVINRSRLRFDARRWYLSKLAPKRYGDKLTQEITNPDGSLRPMNEAQAAGRLAAIMAAALARKATGEIPDAEGEEPGADLV